MIHYNIMTFMANATFPRGGTEEFPDTLKLTLHRVNTVYICGY